LGAAKFILLFANQNKFKEQKLSVAFALNNSVVNNHLLIYF